MYRFSTLAEALVTCRMVRHSQCAVKLMANIRMPALRTNRRRLLFDVSQWMSARRRVDDAAAATLHDSPLDADHAQPHDSSDGDAGGEHHYAVARLAHSERAAAASPEPERVSDSLTYARGAETLDMLVLPSRHAATRATRFVVRNRTLFFDCRSDDTDVHGNACGG